MPQFRTLLSRLWSGALIGGYDQGRRSVYDTFGYPVAVTNEQLEQLYLRGGIAHRIIQSYSSGTWSDTPLIRDEAGSSGKEGDRNYSPFVEAVEAFFKYAGVQMAMERADRLSTIGRFGILLMGFNDGIRDLRQPLDRRMGLKLNYLQPYGNPTVCVEQYDSDPSSPRFGMPVLYSLQTNRSYDVGAVDSGAPTQPLVIHFSRVVHIAETMMEDGVNGVPRLLPVYNRLLDLEKVIGGSAEAFWRNADPGMSLTIDKEAQVDESDIADIKKQAQEMRDRWEKIMVGVGITPQMLAATIADPGPTVEKLMDEIAGAVGVPKRVLIGSERGELSSTQDSSEWGRRLQTRRELFATPSMLHPFIDIMIATGNLPEPEGSWWVEWPEIETLDPSTEAAATAARAGALATYANAPAATIIVPPAEFREKFMKLPPEPDYEIEEEIALPELDMGTEPAAPAIVNAAPRPLYAFRPVLNTGPIRTWARRQGFKDLVPANEMHVTLVYCTNPFDWMKVRASGFSFDQDTEGRLSIPPGGVRIVEALGNTGAKVLMFPDDRLQWRHEEIVNAGAQWPWPEYQPHITLSYGDEDLDLNGVEPYPGMILLGPEKFVVNEQ